MSLLQGLSPDEAAKPCERGAISGRQEPEEQGPEPRVPVRRHEAQHSRHEVQEQQTLGAKCEIETNISKYDSCFGEY